MFVYCPFVCDALRCRMRLLAISLCSQAGLVKMD
jgi:hypothetical protein